MDGTLSDCRHRLHWIESTGKKNWEKFFSAGKNDQPHSEILRLALELSGKNAIVIASGRPEHLRRETADWLTKFGVPFSGIYLRKDDDRRPDGIVKAELLACMQRDGFAPWLAVDNSDTAVAAWRESGVCCLQCDLSNY